MARLKELRYAFNRGLISALGIARVDLKRYALSAAVMTNWMCRTLGSMMLRAGLGYLGAIEAPGSSVARIIEFIFSTDDTRVLQFTNNFLRVWDQDALVTRPAVTTAVTNPDFTVNLAGWTVTGGTTWAAPGYMQFIANGTVYQTGYQQVTVAGANIGVLHALRIEIIRGPVTLRVGNALAGDQYVSQTDLGEGFHSIAFTPTTDFWVQFQSRLERIVLVNSCNIETAGVLTLPTPWPDSALQNIRGGVNSQSADVQFIACKGYQQRKIERRNNNSWSVVLYQPEDGPFRPINTSPTTMTASVITGNGTLTSSQPYFKTGMVGGLFTLTSTGQTVSKSMTVVNDSTNPIRVTGVGTDRNFTIDISGLSGTGNTVILQRSFDGTTWVAVPTYTWNADVTTSYTDGLENQIVLYRLRCTVYAGGTTISTLSITTGSIIGAVRITAFTTNVLVNMEVFSALGGTTATDEWAEGLWSDYRGWPTSGALYEGRLWWAGLNGIVGSISDQFDGFDPNTVGDSGPINRFIGSGPVDTINWVLPLQRLLLGAQGSEQSCRSTAFDEPLTPSNFNIKPTSNQGSSNVQAIKIDSQGMYVQRGGTRLFDLKFNPQVYDYESDDLTELVPEIGGPFGTTVHIVRVAAQRQPDTRIHCVRTDGIAAALVFDRAENVKAWLQVETEGEIEDVCMLPGVAGQREDQVYYVVKRTINGNVVRYLEKWALETDCVGGTVNKQADSYIQFTGPTLTVSAPHLAGETVVVWQDGVCPEDADGNIKTFTADGSGNITLDTVANSGIVGLPYMAQFQSAKLGQTLTQQKNVQGLGLVLYQTHCKGLWFGPELDVTTMDNPSLAPNGFPISPNTIYGTFDGQPFPFPGTWDSDSRLCLIARAPRPACVLAAVINGEVND